MRGSGLAGHVWAFGCLASPPCVFLTRAGQTRSLWGSRLSLLAASVLEVNGNRGPGLESQARHRRRCW